MAPGVSGALITTVTALCVAIPAMFGYNFLVTSIRAMIVEMDNFAAELASEFEHKYVEHSARVSGFPPMNRALFMNSGASGTSADSAANAIRWE